MPDTDQTSRFPALGASLAGFEDAGRIVGAERETAAAYALRKAREDLAAWQVRKWGGRTLAALVALVVMAGSVQAEDVAATYCYAAAFGTDESAKLNFDGTWTLASRDALLRDLDGLLHRKDRTIASCVLGNLLTNYDAVPRSKHDGRPCPVGLWDNGQVDAVLAHDPNVAACMPAAKCIIGDLCS